MFRVTQFETSEVSQQGSSEARRPEMPSSPVSGFVKKASSWKAYNSPELQLSTKSPKYDMVNSMSTYNLASSELRLKVVVVE